ncbi:MAG: hypothetical protein H6738_13820 [Alphaproteobacteria bacterium]|nr:hypothetical protein [Alphaproteobacteria bacterium]MCB9697854.1 hypothetical protein [Alphaproteobacteria bacterium]
MREALEAWLATAARGGDAFAAVRSAAEAVASQPWDVVQLAGRLARAKYAIAEEDLGLTPALKVVAPDARSAIARIDEGQPYPLYDASGRAGRGAFDTPVDMARRVVRATLRAVEGQLTTGLDTACGTGAFLLAMAEAGIPEIYGTDLDELALEVARIAVPHARILRDDALRHGPPVDVMCGNPPYVPPELQDREMRKELRRRFPWLRGRFDLVVPFAAVAVDRVRPGGAAGLVMPFAAMVQPYGSILRRRWVERHHLMELSGPMGFPGVSIEVALVVLQAGTGPRPLPSGVAPEELLWLDNVPLDPILQPGDVDLIESIRSRCVTLGSLATVDTGLVAHGPAGGKGSLIHDEHAPGRKPYADARDFFAGNRRWIDYVPGKMHRPKSPALFEPNKVVVQRIRGKGPVKAAVDRNGTFVGHTCTVIVPKHPQLDLDRLVGLVTDPLISGFLRLERGQRIDLYPKDVASIPISMDWLSTPGMTVAEMLGLTTESEARLERAAGR